MTLNYQKNTGEQFTQGLGLLLRFQHPFRVEQVTIPINQTSTGKKNKHFFFNRQTPRDKRSFDLW